MTEPITVLVADDHPMFRNGLRFALDQLGDVEVVGEAACGEDAVRLAAELQPDVVIMDLSMPGQGGIAATRDLALASPQVRVLVLTMHEDDASVFAAVKAGACGYLLKGALQDQIATAVRAVAAGHAVFGPDLAIRILSYFTAPRQAVAGAFPGLSEREREVLAQLADGKNNAAIAQALFVSPKTVRNHVSNILVKLQVADRTEAMIKARDAGLGEQRTP